MSDRRPFYKLDFRHGTVEEIDPAHEGHASWAERHTLAVLLVGAVLGWLFAEYVL